MAFLIAVMADDRQHTLLTRIVTVEPDEHPPDEMIDRILIDAVAVLPDARSRLASHRLY